jgi:hypothetical protein
MAYVLGRTHVFLAASAAAKPLAANAAVQPGSTSIRPAAQPGTKCTTTAASSSAPSSSPYVTIASSQAATDAPTFTKPVFPLQAAVG